MYRVLLCLLLAGCLATGSGCAPRDDTLVARMEGFQVHVDGVSVLHSRLYPDLPFESTSCEQRKKLLTDIVNNELLLGIAREEAIEPSRPLRRRIASESERKLIDNFFEHLTAAFGVSSSAYRDLSDRLHRQVHLLRIVCRDAEDADSCFAALQSGMPFEAAYQRYGLDLGSQATEMDMGWVTPETLPPPIVRRVFLGAEDIEEQLISPVATRRGFWIVKPLQFASVQLRASQLALIDRMIRKVAFEDSLVSHSAQLKKRRQLEVHEQRFPIINRAFNAYWDSLDAIDKEGRVNRMDTYAWRPPLWKISTADQGLVLVETAERSWTIRDFMESLDDCDVEFWPAGPTPQHRQKEIHDRILRLLLVEEARRIGLHLQPEYQSVVQRLHEEALLDAFYEERILPSIEVTPREVREHYEAGPERYQIHERASFTVLRFPAGSKGQAEAFREAHADDTPRDWALAAIAAADADTNVVFHRDRGVFDLEERPRTLLHLQVFPVVKELEAGQVSEVFSLLDGHAIVRCNYRRHAEPMPPAMAYPLAEAEVRQKKTDEIVEPLLELARESREVRMWPDRLCRELP